jgi:hypothetical protein
MGSDLPAQSLALAAGIVLIAVFLGLRQWYEWRARDTELSEADQSYFVRQDRRRYLGVALLLIIALAIAVGSRMQPKVAGRVNAIYFDIWLAVLVLVLVLLALALSDWRAIRTYASRQRESITRERLDLLADSYRQTGRNQQDDQGQQKPKP